MATSLQPVLITLPGRADPQAQSKHLAYLVADRQDGSVALASSNLSEVLQLPPYATSSGLRAQELLARSAATGQERELAALRQQLNGPMEEPASPARTLLTADGARSLQISTHALDDRYCLVSIEDVSERAAARHDVYTLAYQDALTGLANRSAFENKLDHQLADIEAGRLDRLAILFLDLDHFKGVNDTLGHGVGDSLLRLVSERVRSALRESDLAARLGGDEFAILLPSFSEPAALAELSRRLIDLLQRPFLVDGHVINIGASVGIALAPSDGVTRQQLLRSADLALYHSKRSGRREYTFFQPAMEQRAQERRAVELDLRKALLLRQFELHYQPQINVESQRVIGMEGLLRWRHPKRGLLLPAEFLPLAEEIGLAVSIGEWVLRTACKEASRWPDDLTVAINISPLHFENTNFAESVQRALEASQLPGSRLEIEVTEDVLLRDGTCILLTLDALRRLDVRVAMDSFGTGVASLGQLVNFPFDKIKIDRSLVSGTSADHRGRAIMRAISALGKSLGITTLAAGVETREHLADVRSDGCHHVQGFYYSPAIPAGDILTLLSAQLPAPAA